MAPKSKRSIAIALTLIGMPAALDAQPLLLQYDSGPFTGLGRSVANAGDVDGDGVEDLLAGANFSGVGLPSRAVVISGANGALLYEFLAPKADQLGISVAGIGDADADGFADFVVGASHVATAGGGIGEARVFTGSTGALLFVVDRPGVGSLLGTSTCGPGDVDQDGFDDVAAGGPAWSLTIPGRVLVASGKTGALIHEILAVAPNNGFGTAIAPVGDLDHDGYPDLVAGSSRDDTGAPDGGRVDVFSGKDASIISSWIGDYIDGELGVAVAGGVDLNLDGTPDVVATGTGLVLGFGAVRALSGADGAELWTRSGDVKGTLFGRSVATGGDFDGDGGVDVIVGSPNENGNGGVVSVLSGSDGTRLSRIPGQPATYLGTSVASIADTNGDGLAEVLAGAPSPGSIFSPLRGALLYGGLSCGGTSSSFGTGCAGSSGVTPALEPAHGCIGADGWVGVRMDTYYSSTAFLFVSPSAVDLPLGGACSLLVAPGGPMLVMPAWMLYNGLNAQLPSVVPTGSVHMQAFVSDSNASLGFAGTGRLTLHLP